MKFVSTLALTSLAVLNSTVEAASYSDKASMEHDAELMEWYLEGVRGLWFGFYRGFFHERQRPQSTCLSADVEDEMSEIM